MLAGRKLLLADDSATIQKVVDLTFADEGVQVVIVGDGQEAIEKVDQIIPDVVLADVFMPKINGYAVCEYIKGSEKLKHIPVMLLVGSFEPFDEAEARRVGANDILTKPFQSIRRLIEKVGDLVSGKPPHTELPTAEFPKPEEPEEPKLSPRELEITTADTLRLPSKLAHQAHQFVASKQMRAPEPWTEKNMQESGNNAQRRTASEPSDTLLDLGDFETTQELVVDDFELDLDMEQSESTPTPAASGAPAFVESKWSSPSIVGWEDSSRDPDVVGALPAAMQAEPFAAEIAAEVPFESSATDSSRNWGAGETSATPATDYRPAQVQPTVDNLSPELIEAIARRAVEHLSEKVVQEIAWEVVPQLAELLIKRQLEEKESQTN